MTRVLVYCLLSGVLIFSLHGSVSAQESEALTIKVPQAGALESNVPGVKTIENKMVSVELNKGTMIKLSRPSSSVVIADPGTADVQVISPNLIFVRGKKIGETTLYAIDGEEDEIMDAVVSVTHNISSLERAVKRAVPDSDVSFKTVDGGLVMSGFTDTVGESEDIRNVASTFMGTGDKMVNMIKTNGSDQVMLRVKVVEMSRKNLKKLGVNLQNVTSHGDFGLQVLQGPDLGYYGPSPGTIFYPGSDSPLRSLFDRNGSTDSTTVLRNKNLTAAIDAIETDSLATVLAEPTLTTTTGKSATFLAGGQYPLPVAGGNGTVSVTYQTFGVSLNFTPVVMSKKRMSITIAPEVSTLDFSNPVTVSNFNYPILNTRKASAVVEMGSGDTFVLAGLLSGEVANNINKTPGLGDLPVLGALFRSIQFQNNQTELVILVTPYIVHPIADPSLVQTPLDGYVPPNDSDLFTKGKLYTQQPMNGSGDKKVSAELQVNGGGGFME